MAPEVKAFLAELVSNKGLGAAASRQIKERAKQLLELTDIPGSRKDLEKFFKFD